jgi:hypothetical protein
MTDNLLEGYQIINPIYWDKIPYQSHIRYLRTDGKFIKGGFIIAVVNDFDQNNAPTLRFDLISNLNSKPVKWSVYKGNIAKIWIKSDEAVAPQMSLPPTPIDKTKEELDYLKQSVDQMRQKMQQMENELIRTLRLIKKLHNIN